jgi:hypothetical protein
MSESNRKRKATDQLSPYSQEPNDEEPQMIEEIPTVPLKRARAKRDAGTPNPALKGIFGNVSLGSQPSKLFGSTGLPIEASKIFGSKAEKSIENSDENIISSLNQSFLESIEKVIKKQPNKDLSYLFEQYSKFIKSLNKNN